MRGILVIFLYWWQNLNLQVSGLNKNMQQKPSERWPENIHHLLDSVEKVAGYTSKKEILQTTSITMVYLLLADAAVISVWDAESQLIVPQDQMWKGTLKRLMIKNSHAAVPINSFFGNFIAKK